MRHGGSEALMDKTTANVKPEPMPDPIPVRFANYSSRPAPSYHLLELPPDLCKLIESGMEDLRFVARALKRQLDITETRF